MDKNRKYFRLLSTDYCLCRFFPKLVLVEKTSIPLFHRKAGLFTFLLPIVRII
jgi:hypothetical protein